MSSAFLFPGQGSQAVGMGKALADQFAVARRVFAEVDDALGQALSSVIWDGPESELTLTSNAQPALMATSIAALRVIEAETGLKLETDCAFVAGHSLGEYSALAAVSAISLADTARLLRIRGDAMQRAVPAGEGAMAALIGCEWDVATAIAEEAGQGEICEIANDNGGGQIVLSGAKGAVERACEIAKLKGVKRAVLLQVSAPFHCSLMQPAAEAMQAALAKVTIKAPRVPVIANVTAQPVFDPDEIRNRLVEQVTGTVRWRESIAYLGSSGVTRFLEIGSGKVLSGLVKRIVEGATTINIATPDDVAGFKALQS
ncbi:MAG: ACP S-malonyltransferase [Beijerinckiaceae bacterium]|nr:ACP S-malonyltransferase [Beijerinckiaceae bacterium]